jgi:hypothetical protein
LSIFSALLFWIRLCGAELAGAVSAAVGSGVGVVSGAVMLDPPPLDPESGVEECGTNGLMIAPTMSRQPMPPQPIEDFFDATCSAYVVGPTQFGH